MGRYRCTPETPWTPAIKGPVEHSDVEEVGDQQSASWGGDLQKYRCKNCGHQWTQELPQ